MKSWAFKFLKALVKAPETMARSLNSKELISRLAKPTDVASFFVLAYDADRQPLDAFGRRGREGHVHLKTWNRVWSAYQAWIQSNNDFIVQKSTKVDNLNLNLCITSSTQRKSVSAAISTSDDRTFVTYDHSKFVFGLVCRKLVGTTFTSLVEGVLA